MTYEDANSNGEEPQTFVHIMDDDLDSSVVPVQTKEEDTANLSSDPLNINGKEALAVASPLQLQVSKIKFFRRKFKD